MTSVACFCGCLYHFDGGEGPCPKCGAVAVASTTAIRQASQHDDERPRGLRGKTRRQVARRAAALAGGAVLALALTAAAPALASSSGPAHRAAPGYSGPPVRFAVVTPSPYGVAGVGGVFNVDIL